MPANSRLHRRSPRQTRSKTTVAILLEAAADILRSQGLRGFNTNRIAERAGVSIGTLYGYFPNKQSVLVAMARELLQADGRAVLGTLDQPVNPDPIASIVAALFTRHRSDPAYRRAVLSAYLGAGLSGVDASRIRLQIGELAEHPRSPLAGRKINQAQLFVIAQAVLGVARSLTEDDSADPAGIDRIQAETNRLIHAYLADIER